MARNYNLVVDFSNFKPFDVSLALSTLKDYRSAYDKLEALANKIAEEKGEYILPESSKYKEIMDKYNTDFDAIVSDFNKGMNYKNATDIRNLVRRYSREVTPIRTMVQNYNKYNDKVLSLGPDAIVGNRERTLDDFYGNINPQISYRNGKTIQQTAAGVMQGLANALMSAPALAGSIANQYFILKQLGLNGNDALQKIMLYNPLLNTDLGVLDTSLLLDALDRVYQLYAFEGGTPENSKIWENVVSGAILGIQAPKYSLQANHDYETAALKASREYTELQTEHYKTAKSLEEEEDNLKLGRVKVDDGNGKYHYTYDPEKAGTILKLRMNTVKDTSSSTPYIPYGGHRYSIKLVKKSDINEKNDVFEIYDIDTKLIVTDPTLMEELKQLYRGKTPSQAPIESGKDSSIPKPKSLTPLTPKKSGGLGGAE